MKKRLMRHLVRLYPKHWRERYEAEFLLMLDNLTPRWWDVIDTFWAMLDAHLNVERHREARKMLKQGLRWLVTAMIALATLAGVGLLALSFLIVPPPTPDNITEISGTLAAIEPTCCADESTDMGIRLAESDRYFYINRAGLDAEMVRQDFPLGETVTLTVFETYLSGGRALLTESVPTVGITSETSSYRPTWFAGTPFTDHRVNGYSVALVILGVAAGLIILRVSILGEPRKRKLATA